MQASVKDGNHLVVVTMFGHSYERKLKMSKKKYMHFQKP
jgi:hypothetical protein